MSMSVSVEVGFAEAEMEGQHDGGRGVWKCSNDSWNGGDSGAEGKDEVRRGSVMVNWSGFPRVVVSFSRMGSSYWKASSRF